MKVLLDECLPRRLKHDLPGHEVVTVPEMARAGIENDELLQLMHPDFDVFLTIDSNSEYQQDLSAVKLAVLVLSAPDNTFETLHPLMPIVLHTLKTIQAGKAFHIGS